MSYTDKLADQAMGALAPGEFFVAAAKYLPRGASSKRAAGGAVFGVAGTLICWLMCRAKPDRWGRYTAEQLGHGLDKSAPAHICIGGRPGARTGHTHSIPLSHVLGVRCETGRKLGFRVSYVAISLADGSQIALEAVSPKSKDGEAFARSVEASRSAAASSSTC